MKGNRAISESAHRGAYRAHRSWRNGTTAHGWSGGVAVLVAAAAIALRACGGGPSSPHVASLGTSNSNGNGHGTGTSTSSPHAGNATQLMDEWATCMRAYGDPNQT